MKKINKKNLLLLITFILCVIRIIKDIICLFLGATFTWFGLITFVITMVISGAIFDYFEDK